MWSNFQNECEKILCEQIFAPKKFHFENFLDSMWKNNSLWAKNVNNVKNNCWSCEGKNHVSKFAPYGLFCSMDDVRRQLSCVYCVFLHQIHFLSHFGQNLLHAHILAFEIYFLTFLQWWTMVNHFARIINGEQLSVVNSEQWWIMVKMWTMLNNGK